MDFAVSLPILTHRGLNIWPKLWCTSVNGVIHIFPPPPLWLCHQNTMDQLGRGEVTLLLVWRHNESSQVHPLPNCKFLSISDCDWIQENSWLQEKGVLLQTCVTYFAVILPCVFLFVLGVVLFLYIKLFPHFFCSSINYIIY